MNARSILGVQKHRYYPQRHIQKRLMHRLAGIIVASRHVLIQIRTERK
jgi:hypothetical protein